jgi:hypothetical protein
MVGVLILVSLALFAMGGYSLLQFTSPDAEMPVVEGLAYFVLASIVGLGAREAYIGRKGLKSGGRTQDARQK